MNTEKIENGEQALALIDKYFQAETRFVAISTIAIVALIITAIISLLLTALAGDLMYLFLGVAAGIAIFVATEVRKSTIQYYDDIIAHLQEVAYELGAYNEAKYDWMDGPGRR